MKYRLSLYQLRQNAGLSIPQVAQMTRIPEKTLEKYEQDSGEVEIPHFKQLASLYKATNYELIFIGKTPNGFIPGLPFELSNDEIKLIQFVRNTPYDVTLFTQMAALIGGAIPNAKGT